MARFTYATRKSALALAQSRAFVEDLRRVHPGDTFVELQVLTSGDRIVDRPLAEIGGKWLFVKEIEQSLFAGEADFAVHSMKDVPSELPEGLTIACVPERADPRDAVISPRFGKLLDLPSGARVGTGSQRRVQSLKAVRPDLDYRPMRGNVDTRLSKVDSGEFDAIVLARAGLIRLGHIGRATDTLNAELCVPAAGQGALGIEARVGDAKTYALLKTLHHDDSGICVAAERAGMRALGGDCHTPIGLFAKRVDVSMRLYGFITEPDGSLPRKHAADFPWPPDHAAAEAIGEAFARAGERL